jgi:hypothetical protein
MGGEGRGEAQDITNTVHYSLRLNVHRSKTIRPTYFSFIFSCIPISSMSFGFGGGGFGAPQQSAFQTPFAAGAAVTPAPNFAGGFGAQPNPAFGGPQGIGAASGFATPAASQFPTAPVFGGGAFPQQGVAAGGFAQQQNTGFGVPQAPGFGSQVGTSTFGAAHQPVGFGATGFAAAPQTGFGAAAPAASFGAPAGGFGVTTATSFGASSFGGVPNPGSFGASGFGAAPATSFSTVGGSGFQGGQQSGFGAAQGVKQEADKQSGTVNSICANMKDQSLESQRFLDYQANRKGPTQGSFGAAAGVGSAVGIASFGQPASSFGQPKPVLGGFGQQPVGFGGQQQQLQQTPAFAGTANIFGTTSATTNSSQAAVPFGASAASTSFFPATGATSFGAPAPLSTNIFGAGSQPSAPGLQTTQAPFSLGGTALGGFGAAPNSGAATAFSGFSNSTAAPFSLNSAVPAFSAAAASSSALAAQAPTVTPSVSAPVPEAKYADAYASRIQLEDTEVGRRYDSAVYARHHSLPVSRDQPPTFIWQTPGKSIKASASRNSVSSTPRHSSRYSTDNASSRSATLPKDDLIVEVPDSLKALNLLHSAILPAWNQLFYSGHSKEQVLNNSQCDVPCQYFNSITRFSLYETKTSPLKGRPIPNYTVQTFSSTQGYQLVAESWAVRFGCDPDRTRKDVPVILKMTVSGDSFQALLEMIVRRYKNYQKRIFEPFSERAVLYDMEEGTPFYAFDIYFEYATPQAPRDVSALRHLPQFLFLSELREDGKFEEIKAIERKMIDSETVPLFYGFPHLAAPGDELGMVSGPTQIFGGSDSDFQKFINDHAAQDSSILREQLRVQRHPDIPKLYLCIGCPVMVDMPKSATMDLQFVAHFSRDEFMKFDGRFSDDRVWKQFLTEFHSHFETHMKSRQFGDFTYEDPNKGGKVRPVHALQALQPLSSAASDSILQARFNFLRENKDAVWQFWASHSFV